MSNPSLIDTKEIIKKFKTLHKKIDETFDALGDENIEENIAVLNYAYIDLINCLNVLNSLKCYVSKRIAKSKAKAEQASAIQTPNAE